MQILDTYLSGLKTSGRRTIEVISLELYESGTFQDHQCRSYQTNISMDSIDRLTETLRQDTRNGSNLASSTMSGIAGSILSPETRSSGIAEITNGWQTTRFRFVLTIMVNASRNGSARRRVLSGWTDIDGADFQGNLDHDMVFHVNSNVEIRDMVSSSSTYGSQTVSNITMNDQVLVGKRPVNNSDRWRGLGRENSYSLRPSDLLSTIGSRLSLGNSDFHQELNDYGNQEYDVQGMLQNFAGGGDDEYRIESADSDFSMGICNSRRSNLNASSYLSSLLGALKSSSTTANEYVDGEAYIYDTAAGNLRENATTDSVFQAFKQLCEFGTTGEFSTAVLMQADPDVDSKTSVYRTGGVTKVFDHTSPENTSEWGRADMDTLVAETLTSSLTGILIDAKVAVCTINFTNMTNNGQIMTEVFVNYMSIEGLDTFAAEDLIRDRFNSEVVPIISQNNDLYLSVTAECDVYEESRITVQIEDERPCEFSAFIAADATKSNVVTNNHKTLNDMANDILNLSSGIESLNGNQQSRRYSNSSVKTY